MDGITLSLYLRGKIQQKEAADIIRAPEQQLNHTAQATMHLIFLSRALHWTYPMVLYQGFLIASGAINMKATKEKALTTEGLSTQEDIVTRGKV